MNRRGLMGMVAALALAGFLGVRADSANARTGCSCCGSACACPNCTCDAKARAGQSCDCCGGASCCSATAETTSFCCSTEADTAATAAVR